MKKTRRVKFPLWPGNLHWCFSFLEKIAKIELRTKQWPPGRRKNLRNLPLFFRRTWYSSSHETVIFLLFHSPWDEIPSPDCTLEWVIFCTRLIFCIEFLSLFWQKESDLSFIISPHFRGLTASIHHIGLITSIHPYCKQQFGSFHHFPLWISFISRTWVWKRKILNRVYQK